MKSLNTMILLLVCGIGPANAQTLPAAPNFLFIFIDDQAWDATSVQMIPGESFSHTANYRMPNLEQIASEGIIFSQDPNDPKLTFSITRRAEDFMDEQAREGHPFYLQLSYYATHDPNQALASTLEKYSGDGAVRAAMTEDLDTNIGALLERCLLN